MNDIEELKTILLNLFDFCKRNNIKLTCDQNGFPFGGSHFQILTHYLDYISIDEEGIRVDYTVNDKERTLHYSNEYNIWIQDE